jgi:hypothetical protein
MVGRYRLTLVDECALEDRSVEPSAAIDRRVEPVSRGQNRASSRRRAKLAKIPPHTKLPGAWTW